MRVLYITVDGLTDHLGHSQILPYLRGLAQRGQRITILSCEKPERLAECPQLAETLRQQGIDWQPIPFWGRPPLVAPFSNLLRLWWNASRLDLRERFQLVHTRSYLAGLVGLWLKRWRSTTFLFDMRGFWPDEKVEGRAWNLNNPVFRLIYWFLKRMEREFFVRADKVISLTHNGKDEILSWLLPGVSEDKIEVIPCCCDLSRFSPQAVPEDQRQRYRQQLALPEKGLVFVYLGSLGAWYCLGEMLDFFAVAQQVYPDSTFLLLTSESDQLIYQEAEHRGLTPSQLRVTRVRPEDVPVVLSLAHVGLMFIRPVFSKKGSSPTKLAEMLAMGLPVVSNSGIGDSDYLDAHYRIGPLVRSFEKEDYLRAAQQLEDYLATPPGAYRKTSQDYFSLTGGVERYDQTYQQLEAGGR